MCHDERYGGKLHGNISWNGYGNAIIGRYGGCFEEDIRRFMCDRAYCITGFGCTDEVCTNSQGEKGQKEKKKGQRKKEKKKKKGQNKKKKGPKKRKKGQCYYPLFPHLCFKVAP